MPLYKWGKKILLNQKQITVENFKNSNIFVFQWFFLLKIGKIKYFRWSRTDWKNFNLKTLEWFLLQLFVVYKCKDNQSSNINYKESEEYSAHFLTETFCQVLPTCWKFNKTGFKPVYMNCQKYSCLKGQAMTP